MTPAPVNYEQTGLKVCLASGTSKAHINDGLLLLHHWHKSHGKRLPNAATAQTGGVLCGVCRAALGGEGLISMPSGDQRASP
ncbi:unnamed protein product [Gadus morhua 'NCC']